MITLWNRHRGDNAASALARSSSDTAQNLPGSDIAPNSSATPQNVSVLLYLTGLCVTLSGLFAVNFGLEDPAFAHRTYALAIAGYIFSYVVRARRIDLQSIQVPLLICVALLILANVSGSGMGWLVPPGIADNRQLGLQMLVAWVAIFHAFALSSDAAVLFACVPSMTMLALVSTLAPEQQEVQNAFLVFIGASTFLIVHENYLRTRNLSMLGRLSGGKKPLLGGQVQLTATCLAGALVLANLVAVPIRTLGQSFIDATGITPLTNPTPRHKPIGLASVKVSEENVLPLAIGPTAESDTILMRIQCERGLYWRGTTFSTYTGHSFENLQADTRMLQGRPFTGKSHVPKILQFKDPSAGNIFGDQQVYQIPQSPFELTVAEMRGSSPATQHVMVVGGVFTSLYGATSMRDVTTALPGLKYNEAGALLEFVPVNTIYEVTSQVPTADTNLLRAASATREDVPVAIGSHYLQIPEANPDDTMRLKQLVAEIIRGKTTNYDKAEAIKSYISEHCKYNLQASPAPHDRDIVAWFLFDKQEGYCDSFAAAMTMLCRYAGIPARLASGFLQGSVEADNTYVVRQKDKHVWAEVFFPHIGWVPFDATEGTVDISPHNIEGKPKYASFIAWLTSHGILPPAIGIALVTLLGYILKTEVIDRVHLGVKLPGQASSRPETNRQIIAIYAQTNALLGRRGLPRLSHQTPDEYAAQVAQSTELTLPMLGSELARLTTVFTRYCYGSDQAHVEDVQEARQAAAAIQDLLHSVKRRDYVTVAPVTSV